MPQLADSKDQGPLSSRESLILEHLSRVRSIARRIQRRLPQHVSVDDLISVGILGLIQAVDNFDPKQGAQLATYADTKIRGAILDSLRQEDWVPRRNRKRSKEIETAIVTAQQKLQRTPSEEEIAAQLGISLTEYHSWLSSLQSLQLGVSAEGDRADMVELIADDEGRTPSDIVERREMEQILAGEIERLPESERVVLFLYYQRDLAPFEIAQVIGLKATRVSQIRCQAIARLRANLTRRLSNKATRNPL